MKLHEYKAYIFDLDGTILDSNPLNIECFLYACKENLGREIDAQEFTSLFGRPLLEQMQYFSEEKAHAMVQTYRTYMDKIHDQKIRLFPGSYEILQELSQNNNQIILVTSKSKHFATRALDLFGITSCFDYKIFCEDCSNHKPHPEPYNLALEKLDYSPHKVLSIGDSPYDILASKKAGLKTAVVSWSEFSRDKISALEPDHIISNFSELLQ